MEEVKDVVRKRAACARVLAVGQGGWVFYPEHLQFFIPAAYQYPKFF